MFCHKYTDRVRIGLFSLYARTGGLMSAPFTDAAAAFSSPCRGPKVFFVVPQRFIEGNGEALKVRYESPECVA